MAFDPTRITQEDLLIGQAPDGTPRVIQCDTNGYIITSPGAAVTSSPAASELHLGSVGGSTPAFHDEFARPADTIPYAVGDAIASATTDSGTTPLRALANAARVNGGSGYIVKVRLWTDQSTCVARFRVHFYTVAAPTDVIPGDNVPMTLRWNNRVQRIGTIDLAAMTTEQATSTAAHTADFSTRLAFKAAGGDTSIYYRIACLDALTPTSGQNWFIDAAIEQN